MAAFVQSAGATTGSATGVNTTAALPKVVGSRNLVCGHCTWGSANTSDLNQVTDDKANSYTIQRRVADAGATQSAASFYLGNITNGPKSITSNTVTLGFRAIIAHEVSGVAPVSPLAQETGQMQSAPGTGTNAVTSGAVTTLISGEYIYGGTLITNDNIATPAFTQGTGFNKRTEVGSASTVNACSEDQVQANPASIAATFTQGQAADNNITFIMTFLPGVVDANPIRKIIDATLPKAFWPKGIKIPKIVPPAVTGGSTAYSLSASPGSYAVTGQAATLSKTLGMSGAAGSYVLTGKADTMSAGRPMSGTAGSYTVTGKAATLNVGRTMSGTAGVYVVTGKVATLSKGLNLSGVAGVYVVTGKAQTYSIGRKLSGSPGSYIVSGQAATTNWPRRLAAAAGSYTVTGQAASFVKGKGLAGSAGSYSVTGQAAATAKALHLSGGLGTFVVTGQAAALPRGRLMSAAAGSFVVTGKPLTANRGVTLQGSPGAYTVTGEPAQLKRTGGFSYVSYNVGSIGQDRSASGALFDVQRYDDPASLLMENIKTPPLIIAGAKRYSRSAKLMVQEDFFAPDGTIVTGRAPSPINLPGGVWEFSGEIGNHYPDVIIKNNSGFASPLNGFNECDALYNLGVVDGEVDLEFVYGALNDEFDIIVRTQDYDNGYFCLAYSSALSAPFNIDTIGFYVFGDGIGFIQLASVPFTPQVGQTYKIVGIVQGTAFSLYLNGALTLSAVADQFLTTGKTFGFGIGNAALVAPRSLVRDVRLYALFPSTH